jgi:hypothetical protein
MHTYIHTYIHTQTYIIHTYIRTHIYIHTYTYVCMYHISLYLCCSDVIISVVRLLFVFFYVLFVCKCVLPPGDNPIAVNKYIIISSYIHTHTHSTPQFCHTNSRMLNKSNTQIHTIFTV